VDPRLNFFLRGERWHGGGKSTKSTYICYKIGLTQCKTKGNYGNCMGYGIGASLSRTVTAQREVPPVAEFRTDDGKVRFPSRNGWLQSTAATTVTVLLWNSIIITASSVSSAAGLCHRDYSHG